jgi:hypothetical protein
MKVKLLVTTLKSSDFILRTLWLREAHPAIDWSGEKIKIGKSEPLRMTTIAERINVVSSEVIGTRGPPPTNSKRIDSVLRLFVGLFDEPQHLPPFV